MSTTHQTAPTPTEDTAGRPARRRPRMVHLVGHTDVDGTTVALCGHRFGPTAWHGKASSTTTVCPACTAEHLLWFGVNA